MNVFRDYFKWSFSLRLGAALSSDLPKKICWLLKDKSQKKLIPTYLDDKEFVKYFVSHLPVCLASWCWFILEKIPLIFCLVLIKNLRLSKETQLLRLKGGNCILHVLRNTSIFPYEKFKGYTLWSSSLPSGYTSKGNGLKHNGN